MVVSVNSEAVAVHDEVKAEVEKIETVLLNYLYEQPGHFAGWHGLIAAVRAKRRQGTEAVSVSFVVRLLREDERIRWYTTEKGRLGYQLTTRQWLAMTRSKQNCSNSSTGCRTTQPTGLGCAG